LAPKIEGLAPNADVGFGGESVDGLKEDDDDEKKSGTFTVDPKADFAGLEDVVGVVLGVGKGNIDGAAPSAFGVKPLPAGKLSAVDGVVTFPKPAKVDGGAGMVAGGLAVELPEEETDAAKKDVGVGSAGGLGAALGFSSKSFCTDIRKFL
jgi:hypothetical protein